MQDASDPYDTICAIPLRYRRGFFSELTHEQQSQLFRSHLAHYVKDHGSLSAAQRAVIQQAYDLLTPEYYDRSKNKIPWKNKVLEPALQITRRAQTLFSPDEVKSIFYLLGPANNGSVNRPLEEIKWQAIQKSFFAGHPQRQADCNCNDNYGCGGAFYCDNSACIYEPYGCGLGGAADCTGCCGAC